MLEKELIKKLRSLKKQEQRIRFSEGVMPPGTELEWSLFFSDKRSKRKNVRHSLEDLLTMASNERKSVFEEYFYRVYVRYFEENGLFLDDLQDPNMLDLFGLPLGATPQEIKYRFRELAKQCHPDCGGNPAKMRDLLDAYHSLLRP